MTKRLTLIVLLAVFAAAQSVAFAQEKSADPKKGTMATAGKEEMIAKIAKYREAGEQKIVDNKFTRKTVALDGADIKETIKQKWDKMDAYYDGTKLVRIQLYPRKGVSERTEEFYLTTSSCLRSSRTRGQSMKAKTPASRAKSCTSTMTR